LFPRTYDVLTQLWPDLLWGSLLLLSTTVLGWIVAKSRSFLPVRAISWWMSNVVLPLVGCRSWGLRTVIIFVNNAGILAALVAAGVWRPLATVSIAAVGWTLGIALRVLGRIHLDWADPGPQASVRLRRHIRAGVWINLLEPPAIAATVGLALLRTSRNFDSQEIWLTFLVWVAPLLAVAAGGEALWIGAGLPRRSKT